MKTRRLVLRDLVRADAQRIAALAGDWAIASMTARVPHPYSEVQALDWIEGRDPAETVRVIEHQGLLIGLVGYTRQNEGDAEIGYWLGRDFWGHGFATEAASAIMHHCYREEGLSRLTCCHFIDNAASKRVIEKLGFRRTGSCSAFCEARREHVPTLRYERRRSMIDKLRRRAA